MKLVPGLLLIFQSAFSFADEKKVIQQIYDLGGKIFSMQGQVVEIVLNRTKAKAPIQKFPIHFPHLTDLSLEQTEAGDMDMIDLAKLFKLEWLNLYRTRVGDEGARHLSRSKSLKHLPIGQTRITDKGIGHLAQMKQLTYLGLRGNKITDKSAPHLA